MDAGDREKRDAFWDGAAEKQYAERSSVNDFFQTFYASRRHELGKRAIDIGCGTGQYLVRLARDGFIVTGVDPSAEMRRMAARRLAEHGVSGTLVAGESARLEFADEAFDLAVSIGAFHFNTWSGVQDSYAEVSRILKRGGYFLLQVKSTHDTAQVRSQIDDHGFTAFNTKGGLAGIPQHLFSQDELLTLGEDHGFTVVGAPNETSWAASGGPDAKRSRWQVVYRKKPAAR